MSWLQGRLLHRMMMVGTICNLIKWTLFFLLASLATWKRLLEVPRPKPGSRVVTWEDPMTGVSEDSSRAPSDSALDALSICFFNFTSAVK